MFPSRDLSVKKVRQRKRSPQRFEVAVFLLCILAAAAGAGQFVTPDFLNEDAGSNILNLDSTLSIAPRETINVAIFKDEKLTSNTPDSSYYSDVVVTIGDTFCFFWGEYDGSKHFAYRRNILLTQYGYTILGQQTTFMNAPAIFQFMHGARGATPGSLVASFYTNLSVHASIGTDSIRFTSVFNQSLAHIANDTFCIVYKKGNRDLGMRKVCIDAGDIIFADNDVTIATNVADNFSNSSVAVDSSGNIIIMITRGASGQPKYLEFLLTNTDYDINVAQTFIDNNISLNAVGDIKYADAPVVSYADKKFAAVYWTSAGIYLYDVTFSGTPPSVSGTNTTQVVAGNTFRAATVATNGKKLIIVWKNLSTHKLEGKIVSINNGVLAAIPAQTEVFSDAATSIGDHGPELNVDINSMGSIALTWKQNKNAVGSIWAARSVVYPTAWWSSVVESVTVIPGDSIVFQAGDVDTSLNMGTATCSLQVGTTNTPPAGWSRWIELSSAADLAQYTKGTGNYFRYKANFTRHATDSIKSPVISEMTFNWNLKPRLTSLDSVKVNGTAVSPFTGFGDTVDVISHTGIADCYFMVHDGDPEDTVYVSVPWLIQPELAKDTLYGPVDRAANIRLMPGTVWDTIYNYSFFGNDNHLWDAVSNSFVIRSRKAAPVITAVTFDGSPVSDSEQVDIILGKPTTVQLAIERPGVVNWNRITYRFITNNFDTSFTTASQLTFQPTGDDMLMRIITTDAFSAADTFLLYFIFPQYATDTANNPGYFFATDMLADSLSYILGTVTLDTVLLPIMNTGTDTLDIDSVFFSGSAQTWLHLGVPQGTGTLFFDSLTTTSGINTFYLLPGTRDTLVFIIDLQSLSGDGVLYDTVIIHTNDPLYRIDTIPVMLGHNDLPVLTGLAVEYDPGIPYWQSRRRAAPDRGYVFPPHAKIAFSFSEPMDSASAVGKTFAYSVFDYNTTGRIDTIPFTQIWSGNYTKLQLRPAITTPSTCFNGLIPPTNTFIPTDSIAVIILSDMRDQATTPGSPNYLDLDNDYVNEPDLDSLSPFRIDSIHFTLESVSPGVSDTGISWGDSIVLIFSDPIYGGTVDTSTHNNRTLLVTTRYNSYIDSTRQVIFDEVYIAGNKAVFKPGKSFFFGDSVYCYYRGVCIRDTLGYSVDMSQNGLPIGFFDSSSTEDDYFWSFSIGNIVSDSVIPDSAETDVSLTTPVTLIFSAPLLPGTIDTSLTGNRSLKVTSRYSEGTQINYDSVVVGTNQATFHLNHRLFYSDSVFCDFSGLVTQDSSNFSVDITGDTIYTNGIGRSWFFIIEPLSLESVRPDSASTNAGIHANISMTFSGPISPTVFDTTTDADSNRSFSFTSAYSVGHRLPISRIRFSSDSTTITIDPQKAFYSYDSINCAFVGFVKNYSYINPMSLIPTDTSEVIGSYSWYFTTKSQGFYTYPNPFKPGSKSKHRALGGIWFKNFHAMKKRGKVTAVKIKVFNINTHPVFESPAINFEENNPNAKPEYFWNTRNNKNAPIASGVYFYAIYDTKGKVLLKGKILIVR